MVSVKNPKVSSEVRVLHMDDCFDPPVLSEFYL